MSVRKKINELYISKTVTLLVPYRGKTRRISYMVTGYFGTEFRLEFNLKSKRYPCQIPYLQNISMELNNEFPTKAQLKKIKNNKA